MMAVSSARSAPFNSAMTFSLPFMTSSATRDETKQAIGGKQNGQVKRVRRQDHMAHSRTASTNQRDEAVLQFVKSPVPACRQNHSPGGHDGSPGLIANC